MGIRPRRSKQILVLEVEGRTHRTGSLTIDTSQRNIHFTKEHKVIYIVASFVDDVLRGRNEELSCIIK